MNNNPGFQEMWRQQRLVAKVATETIWLNNADLSLYKAQAWNSGRICLSEMTHFHSFNLLLESRTTRKIIIRIIDLFIKSFGNNSPESLLGFASWRLILLSDTLLSPLLFFSWAKLFIFIHFRLRSKVTDWHLNGHTFFFVFWQAVSRNFDGFLQSV